MHLEKILDCTFSDKPYPAPNEVRRKVPMTAVEVGQGPNVTT